ncbi:(Fe-S)-binding protein [Clostridia bacterium]|nr:(Fe-S)-binding protein [Clostridia bacterium]
MILDKATLLRISSQFCDESESNFVPTELALRPELAGMRIYSYPLLAAADADDPVFERLREPGIIGPHFMPPGEWLPGARSVISLFLPFTDTVKQANSREAVETPAEWLHGRIEGQAMLNALICRLRDVIQAEGHSCVIPFFDERFWSSGRPAGPGKEGGPSRPGFTSNWSERHAAYAAGLGTFGLSRALITEKGSAGRFCSMITTLPLEPDRRAYTRHDEYCSLCGACARKCPAGAISLRDGKSQEICGAFVDGTMKKYAPRYGCGKCNVGVPCESGIPRGASASRGAPAK